MTDPISDEKLDEIIAACEGVTPGPWKHGYWSGSCHKAAHANGRHPGPKGEDPCIYDYEIFDGGNGVAGAQSQVDVLSSDYDGLAARDVDLSFIARLDPATVLSLAARIKAQDAELARLRADRAGVVEAVGMARTRLDQYADEVNAGRVQGGGREFKRKIWGAFAEYDALAPAPKVEGETSDDGWIEWKGGECPVDHDSRVSLRFRDGTITEPLTGCEFFIWSHLGERGDIIAYRLATGEPKP